MTKQPAGDAEPREEAEERDAEEFLGRAAILPRLSGQEIQFVRLVAAGMTDEEIAAYLGISVGAAKGRLKETRLKWQCRNRTHLVVLALQQKVIRLDELPDLAPTGLAWLTGKETQVLVLLAKNLTGPKIAARLGMHPSAVQSIEGRIRHKWNVGRRADLIELGKSYLAATQLR